MAEEQVLTNVVECKRCANLDSNRETRKKCDQADLDQLLECVGRIKFMGRTLWEFEDFDREERGTLAIMLNKEADHIFEIMGNLSDRLGE